MDTITIHRGMRMFSISFRIFRENNILGQRSRGYRIELEIASRSDSRDHSGAAALFHTYRLRIIFPAVRIFIPFYFIHGLVLLSPFFFSSFSFLFFFETLVASRPRKNNTMGLVPRQDPSSFIFQPVKAIKKIQFANTCRYCESEII